MNQQVLWALVAQTAVIVLVMIFNHARFAARIDDLRSEMNARFNAIDKRFDDLRDWMRSEFSRLEEACPKRNRTSMSG
jgi:hypothetical protein